MLVGGCLASKVRGVCVCVHACACACVCVNTCVYVGTHSVHYRPAGCHLTCHCHNQIPLDPCTSLQIVTGDPATLKLHCPGDSYKPCILFNLTNFLVKSQWSGGPMFVCGLCASHYMPAPTPGFPVAVFFNGSQGAVKWVNCGSHDSQSTSFSVQAGM